MTDIQSNILAIQKKISEYEKKYFRREGSVSLLGVSKNQSVAKIQTAITAGLSAFGENYLQESLEKIRFFASQNIEWHFIGPIQSNKTKKIAENFSWVHSVGNFHIAQRLHDQRPDWLPPLNVCIQVNIDSENTKSGVSPEYTADLFEHCLSLSRLTLRGLMVIPAPQITFAAQRAVFHKVHILLTHLQEKGFMLDTLSMGMSEDYEAAIAEGSSIVRIGTGIFGARN